MSKALIVYATLSGATRSIADLIAQGVRRAGCDAEVVNANEIKKEDDLIGYDAYVFGSATYHGQMMQPMKTLLFLASKINLEGLPGGAFGAFGWSGEAPGRIYDTMANILKMNMVEGPLRLKNAFVQGGSTAAENYGREITHKMDSR
jgi:NAD(P)H dehydrogenase (quinone)